MQIIMKFVLLGTNREGFCSNKQVMVLFVPSNKILNPHMRPGLQDNPTGLEAQFFLNQLLFGCM